MEDNDTDIYVIRKILDNDHPNLQLHLLRDGADALAYFAKLNADDKLALPSLVLLDLSLPKVSGVEVLKELRSSPRCKSTRVIVVSSSDSQLDMDVVHQLGVQSYFVKPRDLAAYMGLSKVIASVLPPSEGSGH